MTYKITRNKDTAQESLITIIKSNSEAQNEKCTEY